MLIAFLLLFAGLTGILIAIFIAFLAWVCLTQGRTHWSMIASPFVLLLAIAVFSGALIVLTNVNAVAAPACS